MFTQHVKPSQGDKTVIVCIEDATGRKVWESEAHRDTHPECRANPDIPLKHHDGTSLDSTRAMCADCKSHFGVA